MVGEGAWFGLQRLGFKMYLWHLAWEEFLGFSLLSVAVMWKISSARLF